MKRIKQFRCYVIRVFRKQKSLNPLESVHLQYLNVSNALKKDLKTT